MSIPLSQKIEQLKEQARRGVQTRMTPHQVRLLLRSQRTLRKWLGN